jgi:tetratricopeptide (TPR) repeat protein
MQDAQALYQRIIQADSANVDAHYFLGATCHALGKLDEAAASLSRAIHLNPERADAHHHLGVLLAQLGKLDESIARLEQACRLAPDSAAMLENLRQVRMARDKNLAIALTEQGKLDDAASCYRRVLELNPQDAGAHNNLGIVLQMQSRFEEAEACYRQVLALNPNDAAAHNNLGAALHRQGKLEESVSCFHRAATLKPDDIGAYRNLAPVLHKQGRFEEAVACYRRVLQLAPDHVDTHYDLGVELQKLIKFDEARACYQRALALDPDHADAHNNLGTLWADLRQQDDAAACYRRAIELKPDHADAHQNLALVLLLQGKFAEGWPEYDWRLKVKPLPGAALAQPCWTGEPLPEGTILLRAEQGLGDTLQFVRYAELVKRQVGRVVVECQAPVTRLVASCAGVDQVIAMKEPLGDFDVQLPLLSLPYVLGTRLDSIPNRIPYLSTDSELVRRWKDELDEPGMLKVGIAWQGSPSHGRDRFRSIPLAHFAGILKLPGVRVYSLQMGAGREQLASLPAEAPIRDLGDRLGDFYDTAAIVSNLDLVITCDSAPAHLAGALGVRVWVALPFAPDWRWLLERSDNPWYPTMRLFRQSAPGDWKGVFQNIVDELARMV